MLRSLRELLRYRLLVEYFVILDLKARYRGTFFGFLWTLINPLMLMAVMWAIFSTFGRIDESNYALFLLAALIAWELFSQSVSRSLMTLISNRGLMQMIYVPKMVFPVSIVCSNALNVVFFVAAYLILALPTDHGVPWTIVLLPLVMLMLFVLSVGAALVMSTLTVFFRDLGHLTSPLLRALFYLTPIFYRPDMFGPKAQFLLSLNPIYYPVMATREVMYDGVVPSLETWLIGFGVALGVLVLGLAVFIRSEDRFVYYA